MENIRKRIKIVLVNSARRHGWQTSKPTFKRFAIFDSDLVGVELAQTTLTFDKPIYVGFTVLELSKLLMYRFHFETIKPNFPQSTLCFTDTDSFLYHIEIEALYDHLYRLRTHFDFSNYPEDHPLYSLTNKAVIGKFKDETASVPIIEFCGLRSKMYSILTADGKQKMAAAGIKKAVAKRELHHQLYKKILVGPSMVQSVDEPFEDLYVNQKTFRSFNHQVYTIDTRKVGLTRYDDKRWILSDGVSTRPHGHYMNSD